MFALPTTKPSRRPSSFARLHLEKLEDRLTPATPPVWDTYTSAQAFSLHSKPGSNRIIYLDFDGHTITGTRWNSSGPITFQAWSIDANRSSFSTAEQDKIIEIWRMVAEDFAPFDIDVTTEDPGAAALIYSGAGDTRWGKRVCIGPDPIATGAGGVAYLNSFRWNTDEPALSFNGDLSASPETSMPVTISHEVGHTLGLNHDGTTSAAYYGGHGAGVTSWGPIMGAPFGRNVTTWSRASYTNANNNEDDLTIITSASNGVVYRTDDHGATNATAKALNGVLQGTLTTTYGIIERNTDVDYFKFMANPGAANIQIDPLAFGPNLDIQAELYSPTGTLLQTSNPAGALNATFTLSLPTKGTYYIRISGAGLAGPTGYSNYGSLGNYRISGTVPPFTPPASSLRVMNPPRWTYSGGTYRGNVSITNITKTALTGDMVFVFKFPPGVTVASGPGQYVGSAYHVSYNGTLAPGKSISFTFQLTKAANVTLKTGLNSYFSDLLFA